MCITFPRVAVTKSHALETTGVSSLATLEAGSPKPKCQQGLAPSEGSGEKNLFFFFCLLMLLMAPSNASHSLAGDSLTPFSPYSSLHAPVSFLIRTLVIGLRVHPNAIQSCLN